VDLIIGAVNKNSSKRGNKDRPSSWSNTDFGWITSGCSKFKGSKMIVATTIECKDLERFWELKEESKENLESEICEENFTKTTHRLFGTICCEESL